MFFLDAIEYLSKRAEYHSRCSVNASSREEMIAQGKVADHYQWVVQELKEEQGRLVREEEGKLSAQDDGLFVE